MLASQQLNSERLKRFVRHISLVQQKVRIRDVARFNLKKQIENIKKHTFALPKKKKSTMQQELERLENAVKEVIEKESSILTKEDASSQELRQKITALEHEFEASRQQGLGLFNTLKDTIEDLNKRLSKSVSEDLHTELFAIKQQLSDFKNSGLCSADLHEEIKKFEENIYKAIIENVPVNKALSKNVEELKNKVRDLISAKEEREYKITKLEEKIKQETEESSTEDAIIKLEEKILSLKEQGRYDPAMIEKLQQKISLLKAKLANLKLDRIEKKVDDKLAQLPQEQMYSDSSEEGYLQDKNQDLSQSSVQHQFAAASQQSYEDAPETQTLFPEDLPKENSKESAFSKLNIPGLDESHGIEFSTKGAMELGGEQLEQENDALDIPPPPPLDQVKKKGLFDKFAEMLGK